MTKRKDLPLEKRFPLGSKVCLKSGGPPMTVLSHYEERSVECIWYCHVQTEFSCETFDKKVLVRLTGHHEQEFFDRLESVHKKVVVRW